MVRARHPPNGWHSDGVVTHSSLRLAGKPPGHRSGVFFLFSSRLGCLGSLALSALLTVILLLALDVL